MIAHPDSGAEVCPFGSSLRSPHHRPKPTVPPLPCRGWHVPQGQTSAPSCLPSAPSGSPAAAGVIPVFAGKRLSRKSSGQPSQRSRTLPAEVHAAAPSGFPAAAGVLPVLQEMTDREQKRPKMLPVLQKFTDREHFARILRPFFSAVVMLALAACSRPASYEQFIKAENARDGVYEFAIPATILTSASSVNTTAHPASAAAAAPAPTFDISLYTAPLEKALQLDILWLELPSGDLSHFSSEMPQVPSENGGPGANMPQNAADTTKIDTTCSNNGVLCDRSAPWPRIIHEESVWFPAGKHRVLYRSGLALGNVPEPCASQDTAGIPGGTHATPAPRIMLKIKPVNPPGSFRGLGIICKRNDGTR